MALQLNISKYSDKSFVVRGNTKKYKDFLLERHGKYNPNLKIGGPGWVFSNRHLDSLNKFVDQVNCSVKIKDLDPDVPTHFRKRKVDEPVYECYEQTLQKKIRKEIEAKVDEHNQTVFSYPDMEGPSFSVGLINRKYPNITYLPVLKKRYFLWIILLFVFVYVSYIIPYVNEWVSVIDMSNAETMLINICNWTNI